ncbi:unnamed protein product [Prunus armeniaca]
MEISYHWIVGKNLIGELITRHVDNLKKFGRRTEVDVTSPRASPIHWVPLLARAIFCCENNILGLPPLAASPPPYWKCSKSIGSKGPKGRRALVARGPRGGLGGGGANPKCDFQQQEAARASSGAHKPGQARGGGWPKLQPAGCDDVSAAV